MAPDAPRAGDRMREPRPISSVLASASQNTSCSVAPADCLLAAFWLLPLLLYGCLNISHSDCQERSSDWVRQPILMTV